MFDFFLFDSWYYDESAPVSSIEVQSGEVVYNGYILHKTDTCFLSFFGGVNWPTVELQNYNLPNTYGQGNSSSFTRNNTFEVRGTLKAWSYEELTQRKDTMKSILAEQNQYLQANFGGSIRRQKAFVTDLSFDEQHYNITFVPFTLSFHLLQGYWEDVALTSVSFLSNTTTLIEEIVSNSTFLETRPVFNIVFNSASSTTEFSLEMGDNDIVVNETFATNDVLIIDSDKKSVRLNGNPIDFDGTFPILIRGNNSFQMSSNGTYNISLTVNYRKTFI